MFLPSWPSILQLGTYFAATLFSLRCQYLLAWRYRQPSMKKIPFSYLPLVNTLIIPIPWLFPNNVLHVHNHLFNFNFKMFAIDDRPWCSEADFTDRNWQIVSSGVSGSLPEGIDNHTSSIGAWGNHIGAVNLHTMVHAKSPKYRY